MENVIIGNGTYLIERVFVGHQSVTELIQQRVEADCSQLFTLTNPADASYNSGGGNAGSRRNHANQ